MGARNTEIARLFNRMAELLEIEGANPFRVRAYRRAAATIEDMPESVAAMVAEGKDLSRLPTIGEDLAEKIAEIVATGHLGALEEIEARTPAGLAEMTALPGIGPKRVQALREALDISSVKDLAEAAQAGRIRGLPGFGARTEARLVEAIEMQAEASKRFRLSVAEDIARGIEEHLRSAPGVGRIITAGSFRRRRDTVGDLDILVTASDGAAVIAHFTSNEAVADILSRGTTRSTVRLRSGIQVDLRVVPEESYGAALHYFTGSKDHVVAIRRIAQDRGLKINEYGVFRGAERLAGRTEEEVYRIVGLAYILPELRENRGEIEASARKRLPKLVRIEDIRGDLHVHTRESDGSSSLAEMAEAARNRGYEYLAITDHSRHATIAHGLDARRLSEQLDDIDRLNDHIEGIRVLKSCEVDILADGSLDLPDSILKRLDLTLGAVHSNFDLDAERQTERIVRAMDNRHLNILAHPTGRLIGERRPYEVDVERVMAAARERGCFLEVNAHPSRLDLNDVHCRTAREIGLKLAISSDAHSTLGLDVMRFGIDQARRGWIGPDDVLNTRPWSELAKMLAR